MKENTKVQVKDFVTLIVVIIFVFIVCNISTPYLFYKFGGTHRTILLLDKLKEPEFKPDLIVFGSSKAMFGIDCYQMSEELGVDAYSFTSTGQPPVESSLYYPSLPPSVKTVVQIISAPIKKKGTEIEEKQELPQSIVTNFAMGGYKFKQEIKDINPNMDFTPLERNRFQQNLDARAAIIIPGLTDLLLPRDKAAAVDLKFCNSYLTKRHAMYDRTIEQVIRNGYINSEIEIDTISTNILNGYASFLRRRGINMVVVIMPSNPDTKEFSAKQIEFIGAKSIEFIPNAKVLNYLATVNDSHLFFDAEHLNKDGAKVITSLLDRELINNGIVPKVSAN